MIKTNFMTKHNLDERDWNNLVRFEKTRKGGKINMFEYIAMMRCYNINGGERLAKMITEDDFYEEFLQVYKEHKK